MANYSYTLSVSGALLERRLIKGIEIPPTIATVIGRVAEEQNLGHDFPFGTSFERVAFRREVFESVKELALDGLVTIIKPFQPHEDEEIAALSQRLVLNVEINTVA